MNRWKFLGKYIRRYLWRYLLGLAVLFGVDFANLYVPQYTGVIIDGLAAGSLSSSGVVAICLRILLLAVLLAVGRFGWRWFIFGSARGVERDMRDDMYAHLQTLSAQFYNENKTGDLMAYFTNDLSAVRMMVGPTLLMVFDSITMTVLILFKMIFYVDARLTMYTFIPMAVIAVGCYFYGKEEEKRYDRKQKAFASLSDKVQESISGIRVIKAFNQERAEFASFTAYNRECLDRNLKVEKLRAFFWPLLEAVIAVACLITLIVGGRMTMLGQISLGKFVAFNSYVMMLVWPMIAVGDSINTATQGMASLERIGLLMYVKPTVVDGRQVIEQAHLTGDIVCRGLSFRYPNSGLDALSGLDLHVAPGETLAVIGKTGSGKSTLVNLLLRVYDAPAGTIALDGHDIKDYSLKALRDNIAYVPQDNFLFSDTLANNIAFGLDDGPDADRRRVMVEKAAAEACLDTSIKEFPAQYETVVGERGATLSGGQKQRSAMARALLKDAPILILDDSLSAVDTDTEQQILANLAAIRRGKTTIIIAHRISTIQDADHVLVLDQGRPAEYGTHKQLMRRKGWYYRTFQKQQLAAQLDGYGQEVGS